MIEQLWYTSSYYGFGPHKDIVPRVRAASQGLIKAHYTNPGVPDRLVAYDLPRAYPLTRPLEEAPICLAYFPIDPAGGPEWALVNKRYAGPLDANRPVAFSHLLVAPPEQFFENQKEPLAHQAIQRWRADFWCYKEDERLPKGPAILEPFKPADLAPGPLTAEKLGAVQESLPFVIQAYLSLGSSLRLYIAAEPDDAAALIWGLTFCFPPALLRSLSFSTYERDVLAPTSTQRIVGTCWVEPNTYDLPLSCYNGESGWAINRYSGKKSELPDNPLVAHFANYAARCLVNDQKRADLESLREIARNRGFSTFRDFLGLYRELAETLERPLTKEDITRLFEVGEVERCLTIDVNRRTTVRESAQDQAWWLQSIKPRLAPWFKEKGQAHAAAITAAVAREAAEQLALEMSQPDGGGKPQTEVLNDVLQTCEELLNASSPWLALLKQLSAKFRGMPALPWEQREPLLRRWTALALGATQFTDQHGLHQTRLITAEEQKELHQAMHPWLQPEWEDLAPYFNLSKPQERLPFPDPWQKQIADWAIKNPPPQLESYLWVVQSLQPLFENRLVSGVSGVQSNPALEFYERLVLAGYDAPNRLGLFQRLLAGCQGRSEAEVQVVAKAHLDQWQAVAALRFSGNEATQRALVAIVMHGPEAWSDKMKQEVARLRQEARADTSSASGSGFRLLAEAIAQQVSADLSQTNFKAGELHLRWMEEALPAPENPQPWLTLLQILNDSSALLLLKESSAIGRDFWNVRLLLLRQWAAIALAPAQSPGASRPGDATPLTRNERTLLEKEIRPWLKITWEHKELQAYVPLTLPDPWKQITVDWLVEQAPERLTADQQQIIWQPEIAPFFEHSLVRRIGGAQVELTLSFFITFVAGNPEQKARLVHVLLVAPGIIPDVAQRLVQIARLSVTQDVALLVSLGQQEAPDAGIRAAARRVLVDDFSRRWQEWTGTLRKTINDLRAQGDAGTQKALDELAADLAGELAGLLRQADFQSLDSADLQKTEKLLEVLDWLMPLQHPSTTGAPPFWLTLFERLTQQELASRRQKGRQASELPLAERYPWSLRKRLLQQWQHLAGSVEKQIALWLEIRWEELEDLYRLRLPERWQSSAIIWLIVNPLQPSQEHLTAVQLRLVEDHPKDFDDCLWQLLMERQADWRKRALEFLRVLGLGGYRLRMAIVSHFLDLSEADGVLAHDLLHVAIQSNEELLLLLDQPAYLDRFRSYVPFPQVAQLAVQWYLQDAPLEGLDLSRVQAYRPLCQAQDRAAAAAFQATYTALEHRLVDEIVQQFSGPYEHQVLDWLTMLRLLAPAATHPGAWQRLLQELRPSLLQTFSREDACQVRLTLLEQWQEIDRKKAEAEARVVPWLEVPWGDLRELLTAHLPDAWGKAAIAWKVRGDEDWLPPEAQEVISQHLDSFVTCLKGALLASLEAPGNPQARPGYDQALSFFGKLAQADHSHKMHTLIRLLSDEGEIAGTALSRRRLDEETAARLLQRAHLSIEQVLSLDAFVARPSVQERLLRELLAFRGSAQQSESVLKTLAVKRQAADTSPAGVLADVLETLAEEAETQLRQGGWGDSARLTYLLGLLETVAPAERFPEPWRKLVAVVAAHPPSKDQLWGVRLRCLRQWAKLRPSLLEQVRPWLLAANEQEYKSLQSLPAAWRDAACDLLIEQGSHLLTQHQANQLDSDTLLKIVNSDLEHLTKRLKEAIPNDQRRAAALDFFRVLVLLGYPQTGELFAQFVQYAAPDGHLVDAILDAALPADERERRALLEQHLDVLSACRPMPQALEAHVQGFLEQFSVLASADPAQNNFLWVLLDNYRQGRLQQLSDRLQQILEAWSVIYHFLAAAAQPKPLFDAELVGKLSKVLPHLPPAARPGLEQWLLIPLAQQIKNEAALQFTLDELGHTLMRWPQYMVVMLAAYVRNDNARSSQAVLLEGYARCMLKGATSLHDEMQKTEYIQLALQRVLLWKLDDDVLKTLDKSASDWPEADLRKVWKAHTREMEKLKSRWDKARDKVKSYVPFAGKSGPIIELSENTMEALRDIESLLKLDTERKARQAAPERTETALVVASPKASTVTAPLVDRAAPEEESFVCHYGKKRRDTLSISEDQIVLEEKGWSMSYQRADVLEIYWTEPSTRLFKRRRSQEEEEVMIRLVFPPGRWRYLDNIRVKDACKIQELLDPTCKMTKGSWREYYARNL